MPRLDLIHEMVKRALIKDGWTITADPYTISYEGLKLYADLAADRPIAAERGADKIIVEIKSFLGPSLLLDLEVALGQYLIYRSLLAVTAPDRTVYLALTHEVYEKFFKREAIQLVLRANPMALFTVDLSTEEVVLWIK